jgi:hypothetical protein
MQSRLGEALQDTAPRVFVVGSPGAVTVSTVKAVPFQLSAKDSFWFPLSAYEPTAVHAVAELHATPSKEPPNPPAGSGAVWRDQLAPFHVSAKRLLPCPSK